MDIGACIKFGVLFWFSIVFSVLGLLLVMVGVIAQVVYFDDANFVQFNFLSTPALIIFVGIVIFVIAFLGCYGAMKESHWMIMTFSVLLFLLLVLEIAGATAIYMNRNKLEEVVEEKLKNTMQDYWKNQDFQKSWDIMQTEVQCCGMNSYEEWYLVGNRSIPRSCCAEAPMDTQNIPQCTVENVHKDGCLTKVLNVLKNKALILGLSAVGIALIQLVMISFTCTLARSIRKDYQTV